MLYGILRVWIFFLDKNLNDLLAIKKSSDNFKENMLNEFNFVSSINKDCLFCEKHKINQEGK